MESILNKNIIRFVVSGAIDFTQSLTIELYNNDSKIDGCEEVPINDFLGIIAYDICSIVSHYISMEVRTVEPNFSVQPKNIWVRGVKYFHHSHWGFLKEYLNFQQIVDELKGEHNGYELEFNGYDFENHVKQLRNYFGTSVIVHGKEEPLTELENKIIESRNLFKK